jgi:hypothetical protein
VHGDAPRSGGREGQTCSATKRMRRLRTICCATGPPKRLFVTRSTCVAEGNLTRRTHTHARASGITLVAPDVITSTWNSTGVPGSERSSRGSPTCTITIIIITTTIIPIASVARYGADLELVEHHGAVALVEHDLPDHDVGLLVGERRHTPAVDRHTEGARAGYRAGSQ